MFEGEKLESGVATFANWQNGCGEALRLWTSLSLSVERKVNAVTCKLPCTAVFSDSQVRIKSCISFSEGIVPFSFRKIT